MAGATRAPAGPPGSGDTAPGARVDRTARRTAGGAPVAPLVADLFRRSAGRLVASLTRAFGAHRLELAEEVVQDALLRALQVWPFEGVPADPEAWIYRVARNCATDVVRRAGKVEVSSDVARIEQLVATPAIRPQGRDDELSMIFMCCHPDLPFAGRIALTLRTVGGLSTDEIAAAFLTKRTTIQQRIVRAKRAIKRGRIGLHVPTGVERARRLESVQAVLYLMFNEGYAATGGEELIRFELCGEAIRLARLVAGSPATSGPDADALLALLLLQASRLPARTGRDGALVLLQDQDRTLWDRGLVAEGLARMTRAMDAPSLTRYHLEAGIAAAHATAPSWGETAWERIVDLYDLLLGVAPSPVVRVNRAVAVAMTGRVDEALTALEEIAEAELAEYFLLPATRARLLALAGRFEEAAVACRRALLGCRSEPMRRHLLAQLAELEGS